ncbi:MAG TPA: hypothetical protein VEO00_02790 [Actinomycetota bacterium]|nr:hypothetical protein [Actinomycetota bacterium]
MRPRLTDDSGLILKWFARLLIVFAILGVAAVDGISILFAHLRADDAAAAGAIACAAKYRDTGNAQTAETEARDAVTQKDETIKVTTFFINPQTGECTVRTREVATTLVVGRVGFLKKWGIAKAEETATPPTA